MLVPRLTLRQLNRATLARQGLLEPLQTPSVAEAVRRLGSLQAQHPDWPGFALRARQAEGADGDLAGAVKRREVVRASLMRMTVHVVSADDYWPMRTVSTDMRVAQWRAMYKRDPETSPIGRRILAAHPAVIAAMGNGPLAIHEVEAMLSSAIGDVEIPPNRSLWRHFSALVPLVNAPYDGETYGRSRYLPAAFWLGEPDPDALDPAHAAAQVAERYLGAFGPASVADLAAYVGRGKDMGRWRRAIDELEPRLVHFVDEAGRPLVDLHDAPRPTGEVAAAPRLLARWDSLLLAYGTRDRTRVLDEAHRTTVITKNADVLPTFLIDGMVAGTWMPRHAADGGRSVELRPFGRLAAGDRAVLEREGERLLATAAAGVFARYPGTN